jgi:uncharacterized membrane protein
MRILRTVIEWYQAKEQVVAFAEGKTPGLKPALFAAAKVVLLTYLVYFLIKSALSIVPVIIIIGLALMILKGLTK